jgi:serine/threonine-protein kinase 11
MLRSRDRRSFSLEPMLIKDQESKPQTKLNQYVLAGRLGRGSNSNVHLAVDNDTGLQFAAKAIRLDHLSSVTLQREVRNMRRLNHPNIIRLIEVLHRKDTNTAYLILEYARCSLKGQRFTEAQAVFVFRQVVDGLLYLHSQGMVHQDVKPSNLLFFENGVVKIADFGIGHSFASAETVLGTPSYQAPEFLSDDARYDPAKEDAWSLGVTLFESLFGRLPFTGETVYEIAHACSHGPVCPASASEEVRDLLTRMLCPDPEKRIGMAEIARHPWFARPGQPVTEMITAGPKMKTSKSLVSVSAEICDEDYLFVMPPVASSWPGSGRIGLRQFSHFVC